MSAINRLVLDLSHHETVQSYDAMREDGIIGIIYKATQGTSYTDPTYHKERERARAAGMLWGAYHFAEKGNVEAQAKNFLDYAQIQPDELFALDLEDYGSNSMNITQAQSWIEIVEAQLKRPTRCVIYSGNTIKEMLGSRKDPFWAAHRLWLAQYSSTPEVQPSWDTYFLWQYSDGQHGPQPHSVKGCNDQVDSNHYAGTPLQLASTWSGTPTPPLSTVTITVSAPPTVHIQFIQS